jgi:LysR family transcriptional regulator, low CO2-responsive transcriptional regulator
MKEKLNIRMDRVTLRQLRGLAAVARAGTVTAAADQLGLTPPAVSMQIRQLEDTVGMPLAERTSAGFVLTDAGSEVLGTIHRIESALRECGEVLETLHRKEGGRVVVGGVSTAKYFLPQAVASFVESWPGVSVRLQIGNRDEVMAALRSYEIDLAVTGRPPLDIPIRKAAIGDHPYVVIGPPDHPLAGGEAVSLSALERETFIMREEGSGTRSVAARLIAEAGFPAKVGTEMSSNESIKQAVMAGLGVAVISGHTVATELATGRLAMLPVRGLPVRRQWFVTSREEKRLLPPARAFWEFLATRGASFLPDVPGLTPKGRAGSKRTRKGDRKTGRTAGKAAREVSEH